MYGKHHPEEVRQKMSLAKIGKHPSEEARQKMSLAKIGKPSNSKGIKHTEESKIKMSESHKKQWESLSLEARKKNSEAHKGIPSSMKGKRHTEEAKELIRIKSTGRIKSEEERLKISIGNKGKIRSDEHKQRISLANSGENHPNWKGGVTPEHNKIRNSTEYKHWCFQVHKKDSFSCFLCHTKKVSLIAHHIINFSIVCDNKETLFDVNNGITFCRNCHKQFHSKYGYKNNNWDQVMELSYSYNDSTIRNINIGG